MPIFYKTKNFEVSAHDNPHITRKDGGHIKISPKKKVENRWDLTVDQAKELMILSMIVGQAMKKCLNRQGIPVKRINFQDNGNWAFLKKTKPYFHLHLYGRSEKSKYQKFGESLSFPPYKSEFYKTTKPLNKTDIKEIVKQIKKLEKSKKYKEEKWTLS
ncbi:hypothetical protein GF378_00480 [Candidatus Pacearchaeota archaeon]|nr:hypothetical protein [Candidatus Pacearchaeota archaeon]